MEIIAAIAGIIATIVTIILGIFQLQENIQKRRKSRKVKTEDVTEHSDQQKIYHNLPPRINFIGRSSEKARVHEALRTKFNIVSIEGMGGVGKTSLALEVAHEYLEAAKLKRENEKGNGFSSFVWLSGKDRNLALSDLLDIIAQTLEYTGISQQALNNRVIAVQKLLVEKPCLIVIDNFEQTNDIDFQNFLVQIPETSKVIITTREQNLPQAWSVPLKGFSLLESSELIRSEGRRLGLSLLEHADEQTISTLYRGTGGAPLAIKWAAGQMKQKGQSIITVRESLVKARGDMFDNIFSHSWDLLSVPSKQILMILPIFSASASLADIEAATDLHDLILTDALGQLVEMSLVEVDDELGLEHRRYGLHPLTKAFAETKLQNEPNLENESNTKVANFYYAFTKEHKNFWIEERDIQLKKEIPNIIVSIEWCLEHQLLNLFTSVLDNCVFFLTTHGYWDDTLSLSKRSIEIASSTEGGKLWAARFRVWPVSWIYRHRGDLDLAEKEVNAGLLVFQELNDKRLIGNAIRTLGRIAEERAQFDKAELLLREALDILSEFGNKDDKYLAIANLAKVMVERGNLEAAWDLCNQVIDDARGSNQIERIANLLNVMGEILYARQDFEAAREYYEEAISYLRRIDNQLLIADNLVALAQVEINTRHIDAAKPFLLEALNIYKKHGILQKVGMIHTLLQANALSGLEIDR